jgi:hypothetical protein
VVARDVRQPSQAARSEPVLSGEGRPLVTLGSRKSLGNPKALADCQIHPLPGAGRADHPRLWHYPKASRPFPLIVQHNGGPAVNGMVSYDEMGQMLAAHGYMVFHPEIRIPASCGQRPFDAG